MFFSLNRLLYGQKNLLETKIIKDKDLRYG